MNIPTDLVVQQYLMQEYYSVLQVFTDGSKEPESGRTAAAVYIYTFKRIISAFNTHKLFIYVRVGLLQKVW